jgi:hypothetical protein
MRSLQGTSSALQRQAFDHVIIQSISEGLPKFFHVEVDTRCRHRGKLHVNATKGLLMLVQPTDFSDEFNPPAPSHHTITDFQKIVACYLHQTPVVVLSPRFSTVHGDDPSSGDNSINQKKFQKAPNPSPWILRDFFPPSYCWITSSHCTRNQNEMTHVLVTLTNSVMDEVRTIDCIGVSGLWEQYSLFFLNFQLFCPFETVSPLAHLQIICTQCEGASFYDVPWKNEEHVGSPHDYIDR